MSWWEERISNDQAERDKLARNQAIRERMRKDATKIRQHHGWAGKDKRDQLILEMQAGDWSVASLAEYFDVSESRIRTILARKEVSW